MNPARAFALSPLEDGELRALNQQLADTVGPEGIVEDVYPLSPVQEAMLFHALAAEADDLYIVQQRLELYGRLDLRIFQSAWDISMQRHPALRSMFVWERTGRPVQAVCRGITVSVDLVDLSDAPEAADLIEQRVEADRRDRFDFAMPPLMRLVLFRLGPERHELLWSQHHLLEDGWSATTVLQEVFASYEALVASREPELAPVRPYREYIEWLESADDSDSKSFWTEHLAGFDEPMRLTSDAEPSERRYVRTSKTLDPALSDAVKDFARSSHLTLNSVLVGALAIVLGRYTNRTDVAFGTVAAGRLSTLRDVEVMVGMFINTVMLRATIDEAQPVADWIAELLHQQAGMIEHEHTPLSDVQSWTEIGSGVPLTDTLFAYWSFRADDESPENTLRYRTVSGYGHTSFPLSITVEGADPLRIGLDFDGAEFDEDKAERFLEHLVAMLASIVAAPELPVGELEMLTEPERTALAEYNDTAAPVGYSDVVDALRSQVANRPDDIAVVFGDHTMTYTQLDQASDALAAHIAGRAMGGRVGVAMSRSADLLVAFFGVLKAGSTYVPIDGSYPEERVAFILDDADVGLLLVDRPAAERVTSFECDTLVLPVDDDAGEAPYVFIDPRAPAYVMYTSGSTGRPKGVAVSHANLINYVEWAGTVYGDGEPFAMPLYSSIGFDLTVTSLFAPLVAGGTVVVYPEQDAGELVVDEVFSDDAVDVVKLTPSHLVALEDAAFETKRIRSLIVGGEELSGAVAAKVVSASGGRLAVFNEYGPTEATVGCMIHRFDIDGGGDGGVPIGAPAANARIHLLDRSDRPVPLGVTGEICVAGAGVAIGYLDRPELTAESFGAEPQTGEPMYRTGDLGRWRSEGVLEFLGREDEQVKVRGHRIELGEIEATLEAHPGVAHAAVAVREPRPGDVRIVAYYVPSSDTHATLTGLRSHLRLTLPDFMVVQNFVQLESMPLNPHGKLDRSALPEGIGETTTATAFVPPQTPAERLVVSMTSELLGIERVSVTDNFFELGGHSLLSLRLIAQLHSATGERISPRVILLNTLQQAASLLPAAVHQDTPAPVSATAGDATDRAHSVGTSAYFFGPSESPVFGLYSAPSGAHTAEGAVLLCPPVGWEYMRTHWALRKLARLLSTAGLHVLRFDYFGTGDSAGSSRDATVNRWVEDVESAAAELRDAAQTASVSLVGVRLGATLAAVAVDRGLDADHLVLWDPIISGSSYVATLDAMQAETLQARRTPYDRRDLGDELLGFPYPPELRSELAAIDMREMGITTTRGTLVASAARPEYGSFASVSDRWLTYEVVNDAGAWDDVSSSYAALLPTAIPAHIAKIVGTSA